MTKTIGDYIIRNYILFIPKIKFLFQRTKLYLWGLNIS